MGYTNKDLKPKFGRVHNSITMTNVRHLALR